MIPRSASTVLATALAFTAMPAAAAYQCPANSPDLAVDGYVSLQDFDGEVSRGDTHVSYHAHYLGLIPKGFFCFSVQNGPAWENRVATELRMAFDSPDQQKISKELAGKEVVCRGSVTQEGCSMLGVGQKYLVIVNPVCEPK